MITFVKSTMACGEEKPTPCLEVREPEGDGWIKGHIFESKHSRDNVVQFDVEDCAGYFTIDDLEAVVKKMKELRQ
jgi:hypothetical protein